MDRSVESLVEQIVALGPVAVRDAIVSLQRRMALEQAKTSPGVNLWRKVDLALARSPRGLSRSELLRAVPGLAARQVDEAILQAGAREFLVRGDRGRPRTVYLSPVFPLPAEYREGC